MRFGPKAALLGLGGVTVLAALWLTRPQAASRHAPAPTPSTTQPTPAPPNSDVRWIAAAGGGVPEMNQVSLEQDLALASRTFAGPGTVLFAAGAGAPVVQVLAERSAAPDDPAALLADLFAPRGGRDSTYRAPQIQLDGPATAQTVRAAIEAALRGPEEPLFIYLGGHGHRGPTDAENAVELWGQSTLDAIDLAALLGHSARPVQLVATTCFSGGLSELAFADANPDAGPFRGEVCGLFAAPHDLEASGCDPNPDRAAQEGFGLHFLRALTGKTARGASIPADAIDFDADGSIGAREAHAYVRIHSGAFDVPTSTSERWLEAVAPGPGAPRAEVDLPEENAVIAALSRELGLIDDAPRARVHLRGYEAEIETMGEALSRARGIEDEAYRRAAAELLARWPVLDDPWHPDFGDTLGRNLDALREHFASSDRYAAYRAARDEVDRISGDIFDLRAKAAPYERLTRSLEYRRRAARLAAQGGPAWDRFELLRRCELRAPR